MERRMSDNHEKPIFLHLRFMCLIPISFFLLFFLSSLSPTDGYDPLDPKGNITIKWDILEWNQDKYEALLSIFNYQLFRHIETPGWRLSWSWVGDEVIWHMTGAEATEQGNCSRVQGATTLPHSCEKTPIIIDLLPGTPYNMQTSNCCKGGVLSSRVMDPVNYGATFRMTVGLATYNNLNEAKPENFSIGLPGYTCSNATDVPASRFTQDGRRYTRALSTWNITCTYSQFRASLRPTCCVSLSAFYNEAITTCPQCSCGCMGDPKIKCIENTESLLQLPSNKQTNAPIVRCSKHLCPIRVHWHVKTSYTKYWRVKVTVENLNFLKNYSMWSLVIQHPNMRSIDQIFSFNYHSLDQYPVNDTGIFWGIQYYNDMLLQAGDSGNVQSEMILSKEAGNFTFRDGWAFPRKISFNGDECVIPPPDQFPRLPNAASNLQISPQSKKHLLMMASLLVLLTMMIILS
ncbi:COBRA-like protein 1 [Telopea speciosissima]|uniref:COBRA-like protein 1 n=1 Tax=Telopea speciosissima TaxID=54955 RepID=UPI001CC428C7|nr:COBRA-like protein 1 [Telopea speciosissima]